MELIFASQNAGKTKEISALLDGKFQLKNLSECGIVDELDEPFETLEENALHKAFTVFQMTGKPCFADDTGLEINALDGRPGVMSARYGGEEKNADLNIKKVLLEMKDRSDRAAKFRTVIAYVDGTTKKVFEGEVNGQIITEMRGEKGFGYDPVFMPENSEKTFAEMELTEKNLFSHRAIALRKFLDFINR